MGAIFVPPPPLKQPVVDAGGRITAAWQAFCVALYGRTGAAADKVDLAHAAAVGAAPQSTRVVAAGGLQVGGDLSQNVGVALYRAMTAVAMLPATGNSEGDWAYALNGRKPGEGVGAGTGVPVFWSAGHWVAVTSGATVAA